MTKKLLIAYASKCGSTAEIAKSMGKVLLEKGFEVDILPVNQVKTMDGYVGIRAGSAVRVGAGLPEAIDFVKNNQTTMQKIPTAIFTVHGLNWENTSASEALRKNYTNAVKQLISPADEAFFTGKIDYSTMTFLEKMLCKAVKAVEEDRRDWGLINGWAAEIPGKLRLTS
jgi:menaquinone-dependent protoporphyrinogen oxidase